MVLAVQNGVDWKYTVTDIQLYDRLSKEFELSEYKISSEDFTWLDNLEQQITKDYFASELSTLCGKVNQPLHNRV